MDVGIDPHLMSGAVVVVGHVTVIYIVNSEQSKSQKENLYLNIDLC